MTSAPHSEVYSYGRGYRIRCSTWEHYSFLFESIQEQDCYHFACHGHNYYKDKAEFPYYIYIDGRTDEYALDSDDGDYFEELVEEANDNEFEPEEDEEQEDSEETEAVEEEGEEDEEEDEDEKQEAGNGSPPPFDPVVLEAIRNDLLDLGSDLVLKYEGLSQHLQSLESRLQQLSSESGRVSGQVTGLRQEVTKELSSLRRDSIDAQARNRQEIQSWLGQTIQEVLLPAIGRLAGSQEEFHQLTSEVVQQLAESTAKSDASHHEKTIKDLNAEVAELKERLRQATEEKEILGAQVVSSPTRVSRPTEASVDAPGDSSLDSLLQRISEEHEDKVLVLQQALKSASNVRRFKQLSPDRKKNVHNWLISVPEILHGLSYGLSEGNLEAKYRDQSGFELALTESKATKGDKKLMKHRAVTIGGKKLIATAHIKFDEQDLCLRLYYVKHPSEKKLVVVHCGDHLPTARYRRG